MDTHNSAHYIVFIITRQNADQKTREKRATEGDINVEFSSVMSDTLDFGQHWKSHLPLDPEEDAVLIDLLVKAELAQLPGEDPQLGEDKERAAAIKEALEAAFIAGFRDAQAKREANTVVRQVQVLFRKYCGNKDVHIPLEEVQNFMEQAYHQGRRCAEDNPGLRMVNK